MPFANVSKKDILKIIKEFEKIEKLPYEKKRPIHEPTDRYFHLSRELTKCMMRSDNLNGYDHGGYTEMTSPSSKVNVTNEGESKCSIAKEKLSQSCSMNDNKPNAVSSTKLYRKTVPRKRTNYVLQRKANQNNLMRKKRRKE